MNNYLMIIVVLSILAGIIYTSLRVLYYVHMYQLNSYRNERFLRFLKNNTNQIGVTFIGVTLFLSLVSILYWPSIPIVWSIWFVIVSITIVKIRLNKNKVRVKKPLVYTNRVKRLISVITIIYLMINIVVFLNFLGQKGNEIIFYLLIITISMLITPWTMVLASVILVPIEKSINKKFYNEAKRTLDEHEELKVIGITGSYGKTSTKFILETILSQEFNVLATPNSFNTPLGVIITVRKSLSKFTEIFIAEMGAKQKGDIKEICDLVNPDFGIITSVGPMHLETFKSLNNVIDTKFELANALPKGAKCFVNGDSNNVKTGMERYKNIDYISYGTDNNNKVKIKEVKQSVNGSEFMICSEFGEHNFETKLLGLHNIINIAGAVSIAFELGMSYEKIKCGVREIKPVTHRLELKKQGNYYILDDAFNSNPTGAKFALDVLFEFEGNKIIMTPGMIELGDMDEEIHYEYGKQIAKVCDKVVLIGVNKSKDIYRGLEDSNYNMNDVKVFSNVYEGFSYLRSIVKNNDVVLIENDLPDNYNE